MLCQDILVEKIVMVIVVYVFDVHLVLLDQKVSLVTQEHKGLQDLVDLKVLKDKKDISVLKAAKDLKE